MLFEEGLEAIVEQFEFYMDAFRNSSDPKHETYIRLLAFTDGLVACDVLSFTTYDEIQYALMQWLGWHEPRYSTEELKEIILSRCEE